MSTGPAVVVNKGGFLTALVKGIFGTLIVLLICGTALGLYGIHIADRFMGLPGQALSQLPELMRSLPDWQSLPPVIADVLNDRRALDYRRFLDVSTKFRAVQTERGNDGVATVEVVNKGKETVSLLSLRLLIEDEGPEHVERVFLAATPVGCEREWPGLLPPGESRRIAQRVYRLVGEPKVTVEVTDIRVWNGPVTPKEGKGKVAAADSVAEAPASAGQSGVANRN
jgi:hypothetical protein